jgi:hypothetical protein
MKTEYFISSIIIIVIILTINQTINAQLANSSVTKTINEKYAQRNIIDNATKLSYSVPATVHVNYESPSTVLISGDLIQEPLRTFNSDLWEAMDLLKNQYGFKLENVMTSGVGSVGNPTTVYILMTK